VIIQHGRNIAKFASFDANFAKMNNQSASSCESMCI